MALVHGSIGKQAGASTGHAGTPDLRDLTGPGARILRVRRRLGGCKRIVEFEGQSYVLQFFRSKATKARFETTLRQMHEAGIVVQQIHAGAGPHGRWLALSFVAGMPLGRKARPDALAALGRTLARLNGIEGPGPGALFRRQTPKLDHETYLSRYGKMHTAQERRWIAESLARVRRLSANQLTHGDLYGSNILTDGDRSIGLIDYDVMAYDISGIELAASLMRPFCRKDIQRRSLLGAYLAECPPALRETWERHSADLLFAAAARLLVARDWRIRQLTLRNRLLSLWEAVMPAALRTTSAAWRAANIKLIESAERNAVHYRQIAGAMVGICLADPQAEPLALLERIEMQASQQG